MAKKKMNDNDADDKGRKGFAKGGLATAKGTGAAKKGKGFQAGKKPSISFGRKK